MLWLLAGYIWLYLHRPFEVWEFLGDLRVERLYMLLVLAVWAVYPNKRFITNRLQVAVVFFICALFLAWTNSPFPTDLGEKTWDDQLKVFVFFVVLVTTVHDEKSLRFILATLFVSIALYMAHSFVEYLNGRHHYRMGTYRMLGVDKTFNDPNTFSGTLLMVLPYLIPFWLTSENPKTKKYIAAYVLFTLFCITLTGSRRAFVGVGFLAFVLIMYSKRRVQLLLLCLLLAPVAWMLMREDLQNRILTIIDPSFGPLNAQISAEFRYKAFWDGLDLWNRYPLTGVGPGSFGIAVGHGMQSHNIFAQAPAEMGTLGVLGLSMMVFFFWRNDIEAKRLYRRHPWWQPDFVFYVARSTWLATVLMLLMGLGGHNLYRYNWLWFGAFQIIAVHIIRQRAMAEVAVPAYEPAWTRRGLGYQTAW